MPNAHIPAHYRPLSTADRLLTTVYRPLVLCLLATCASGEKTAHKEDTMPLTVTSSAFENQGPIPSTYTCDGNDISPPLTWNGVPENARSIVLIADDPDAPIGTWVHWVVYDIPPTIDSLPANLPRTDSLPLGGAQGITDFKRIGYGGPCPPSGTHRYFFRVYALDTTLDLPAGKSKEEIVKAMEGCVVAEGELVGRYSREP